MSPHKLVLKGPNATIPSDVTLSPAAVVAGTSLPTPSVVTGSFPEEYSLTRPLITNNPGVLATGEDWQDKSVQADIEGNGFWVGQVSSGEDAATWDNPNNPSEKIAQLITNDGIFGTVVRMWHLDGQAIGGASNPNECRKTTGGFTGISKAWYRIPIRFQPEFNARNDGSSAEAHKTVFAGVARAFVFTNAAAFSFKEQGANQYGGTRARLPGSPEPGGGGTFFNWKPSLDNSRGFRPYARSDVGELGDGFWHAMTIYEERVSATHFRLRKWFHQIEDANGLIAAPGTLLRRDQTTDDAGQSWPSGVPSKHGLEYTGTTTDPAGGSDNLEIGVNKNGPFDPGETYYWELGPYEVLDGDVVSDPYGLAGDML